jgi:hypothetical protein
MKRQLPLEIRTFLWKLSDDMRVQRLLELSLGRVLEKNVREGRFALHGVTPQQAAHVADWLTSAVAAEAAWLADLDDLGRPKKLMKFGTVDAVVKEADKSMERFARLNRLVEIRQGEEELFWETGDGFHAVRLMTPRALDRESGEMGHCIGQGAYDARLESGRFMYLSLRDRSGRPHVTMELDLRRSRGPLVLQCVGKQNSPPEPRYAAALVAMCVEKGFRVGNVGDYVFDTHGAVHHVRSLPDGITVPGHLVLAKVADLALPSRMSVHGSLLLSDCGGIAMPDRMTVAHDFAIWGGSISRQGADLHVGGLLSLTGVEVPAGGVAERVDTGRVNAVNVPGWTSLEGLSTRNGTHFEMCGVPDSPGVVADRTAGFCRPAGRVVPWAVPG